jgi:hypothetical protein
MYTPSADLSLLGDFLFNIHPLRSAIPVDSLVKIHTIMCSIPEDSLLNIQYIPLGALYLGTPYSTHASSGTP